MLEGEEGTTEATIEAPEYDGGRDISSVVDAAAKADASPATETPAVTEAPAAATAADTQKAVARAWKAYKDGAELKDFDPATMTAADFLALKFGYNANGKEQQRDFEGIIRNAQQGHYNADKTIRLEQEREHAVREWHSHREKVTQYEGERRHWVQALTAATRGNFAPLKTIVDEFQKALDSEGQPQQQAAGVPEGYVSREEIAAQEAGQRVYNQTVMPEAKKLGEQFGFPPEQVATAIMKMVDQYPAEFLTMDVLNSIMHHELPAILTRLREEHPIPAPEISAEARKIAELEAKLNELTGKKVEQNNSAVKAAHARRAAAPPGVATVPAGGNDLEVSANDSESAAGMRQWLRGLK